MRPNTEFLLFCAAFAGAYALDNHQMQSSVSLVRRQAESDQEQLVKRGGGPTGSDADHTREMLEKLDMKSKQKLWMDLTKDIYRNQGFPFEKYQEPVARSTLRVMVNNFNTRVAKGFEAKNLAKQRCAETGDGHFLHADFGKICSNILVADKYDQHANVKVDLDLPPNKATQDVTAAHGSIDVLVSHQVFEHLGRPSVGMANLNALIKVGGNLIYSTPFVVQDHEDPKDFFRYTVGNVRALLSCAGFEVQELRGLGNRLTDLAFIAGASSSRFDASDLDVDCNGLSTNDDNDCLNKFYTAVAAVGIKKEDKTVDQIHECFG